MARCMLCSSDVADNDVVCPHCGGAVDDTSPRAVDPAGPYTVPGGGAGASDATWVGPAGAQDPTRSAGEGSPWDAPTAPPAWGSSPSPPFGPSPGPTDGGPYPAPYGGPPYGDPGVSPIAGYGGPGYGGPGYGDPGVSPIAGYGGPGYGGPGYGDPGVSPSAGYGGPGYGGPTYGASAWAPAAPGTYGWAPPARTNGLAIASFVTSLAGLVLTLTCLFPILACPVGAVLGHIALRRIGETGEQGRGMALAGIIIGWIATGLLVLGIVFLVAVGLNA